MAQSVSGQNGLAPTPARRSTRLASVARSVASVDQSVAASTTPGRASVRRKGPLPKLKANQSSAYGASGRLGAAEALTINQTGFVQAFDAQRQTAVARDDDDDDDDQSSIGGQSATKTSIIETFERDSPAAPSPSPSISAVHSTTGHNLARRNQVSSFASTSRYAAAPSQASHVDEGSPTPSEIDRSKSYLHEEVMLPTGTTANGSLRSSIHYRAPWVDRDVTHTTGFRRDADITRPSHGLGLNAPPIRRGANLDSPRQPPQASRATQPERDDEPDNKPQSTYNTLVKPRLWDALLIAAILAGSVLLSQVMKHSSSSSPQFLDAFGSRIAYTWNSVIHWIEPPAPESNDLDIGDGIYNASEDEDIVLDPASLGKVSDIDRFIKLERSVQGLSSSVKGLSSKLRTFLPPTIIVTRDRQGYLEIPDEFWRAIVTKLQTKGLDSPTPKVDAAWDEFEEKNRRIINYLLKNPMDRWTALGREEFLDLMAKKYADQAEHVEKRMDMAFAAIKALDKKINSPQDVGRQRADVEENRHLSLALAAIAEIDFRKINFFSIGNGARINQRETSPSYTPSSDITIASKLARIVLPSSHRPPPVTALQPWYEPGDCWCAAPAEGSLGLAQLSVSLGKKMLPRQVTIEHLPKQASVDIKSAPKAVELWVPVTVDQVEGAPNCEAGPDGYVCLGSFTYDIHGPVHVQTVNLDAEVTVPVDKALVRVKSNWGAEHTCIYRVRLHGDLVDGNDDVE
ncbi:hypothetical protein BU24DRAFT_133108 [Aaosphaeria arxii CBS 175.79]|uniref:SUN domain-containing protein n=1 Tax=Aaosphaeria arxii CBS 175.79 TaxID=1450172 RepID=A0A6A5Y683_9PLEO|nr:uncharacterized protein BU24DRAFT_133108 [Aaosphaeria arxii CBS 175.79]KAF2020064.1 hypothetical protein BU24DRAFT_133108 [Aaosphaeria arxii CBS 175.79]